MKKIINTKFLITASILSFSLCTNASLAAETLNVNLNVNKGVVPPYNLYMNHIVNVKGTLDHDRIKALGTTIERAYWMERFWAEGAENGPNYNWTNQPGPYGNDPHFDDIIANGGEILLSIAGNSVSKALPTWLQSPDPYQDFPNDLDKFQRIIEDGLRHLKSKYGDKFRYFETQNEPGGEILNFSNSQISIDKFKLMHERIQMAVNNVNKDLPDNQKIKVICPAVNKWGESVETNIGIMYDYLRSKGLTVENASYHIYGATPLNARTTLNTFHNAIKNNGFDTPIFITEIGYTAANADSSPNCTDGNPDPTATELSRSASYIMASYMAYMDSGINVTPVLFSMHDYANNSRSVLVYKCVDSRAGKVNPLYNTLLMWSKLIAGTRVETVSSEPNASLYGIQGVAVKDGDEIRVLVTNSNTNLDTARVVLNNLPSNFLNGTVIYKRYLVDNTHNNYAANPEADLMKWDSPVEERTMSLSNGSQFDISLDRDATAFLVFSTTGSGDPEPTPDNILTNPGFESGTSPWSFYTNGQGSLSTVSPGASGSSNAVKMDIVQSGDNIQLSQTPLTLNPNKNYTLSFDAYSNTGNDMRISLIKNVSPYSSYGLYNSIVNLSSSWNHYSINFTTSGFSSQVSDARLMFLLSPYAQTGDQYFFDNAVLSESGSETSNPPSAPSGLVVQ